MLVWVDTCWFGWICVGLDGYVLVWVDTCWFGWIRVGLDGYVWV